MDGVDGRAQCGGEHTSVPSSSSPSLPSSSPSLPSPSQISSKLSTDRGWGRVSGDMGGGGRGGGGVKVNG